MLYRYLEDVLPRILYQPSSGRNTRKISSQERRKLEEELYALSLDEKTTAALQTVVTSDRIDFEVSCSWILFIIVLIKVQLIAAVVNHVVTSAEKPSGILIFLPGVQDIRTCIDALRGISNATILPLHANLSSEEQRAVFEPTPGWKIIAATNVAEVVLPSHC